jgi:hypothetical protein
MTANEPWSFSFQGQQNIGLNHRDRGGQRYEDRSAQSGGVAASFAIETQHRARDHR